MINLFLDDMRPCPEGWVLVKTVEEAQHYLKLGIVDHMSLDHDLGACDACLGGKSPAEWLTATNFESMPNCDHFGTGYNLCVWMAEHGIWSKQKPTVHSANASGRERMVGVIERYYGTSPENGWLRVEKTS